MGARLPRRGDRQRPAVEKEVAEPLLLLPPLPDRLPDLAAGDAQRPETREEILDQEAFVVPEADGRGQELLAHLLLPAGNRRQDARDGLPPPGAERLGM